MVNAAGKANIQSKAKRIKVKKDNKRKNNISRYGSDKLKGHKTRA